MSELPFTTEQFLELFASYNEAIWPAQIIAYVLGIYMIYIIVKSYRQADRIVNIILGFFWLWMGIIYHLTFFTGINRAAYLFGGLFIVQGFLFLLLNTLGYSPGYAYKNDAYSHAGGILILYAMLIYPLLGTVFGHSYPASPVYGVAPCPTTIFTFGILLWCQKKVPVWLLAIPFAWSLIGLSAALRLSVYEDIGLPAAGLISLIIIMYRNHTISKEETSVPIQTSHET